MLQLKIDNIINKLPIKHILNDLHDKLLEDYKIITISSSTGSGKSIGVSLFLASIGYTVLVTVPTIPSVLGLYEFARNNVNNPDRIGYACHGEVHYAHNTVLRYATTRHGLNILIDAYKKFKNRNIRLGTKYIFILDEAHHTTTDIMVTFNMALFCLKKKIISKFIVMSATLHEMNYKGLSQFTINCDGRLFPIYKTWYSGKPFDYLQSKFCVDTVYDYTKEIIKKYDSEKTGILIFMSGESEVDDLATLLEFDDDIINNYYVVYRLYSKIIPSEMMKILQPIEPGYKKIVIATNIAESSVTIEDITIVIDLGIQKTPYSDINSLYGMKLIRERISKDKALQRMGRAGRITEGMWFPMYTESEFDEFLDRGLSELETLIPYEIVLIFLDAKLPVQEILNLDRDKYNAIIDKLIRLKLYDDRIFKTTDLGKQIHKYPFTLENSIIIHKSAHTIFKNEDGEECYDEILFLTVTIIVSMIEGSQNGTYQYIPKQYRRNMNTKLEFYNMYFTDICGDNDLITYINIFASMIHESKSLRDKDINTWSLSRFFNAKLLKSARNNFNITVKMFYPDEQYGITTLFKTLENYSYKTIFELGSDEDNMKRVYNLFSEVYSNRIFLHGYHDCKRIYYRSLDNKRYAIDPIRSYTTMGPRDCIIGIQCMEIVNGKQTFHSVSCIFPIPIPNEYLIKDESDELEEWKDDFSIDNISIENN